MSDLQPYSCFRKDCTSNMKTFSSRKAWIAHEYTCQGLSAKWVCIAGCSQSFQQRDDFALHILNQHLNCTTSLDVHDLNDVINACEQQQERSSLTRELVCPFCEDTITESEKRRHIGRHMEEVALRTLPQDNNESQSISDAEDEEIGLDNDRHSPLEDASTHSETTEELVDGIRSPPIIPISRPRI